VRQDTARARLQALNQQDALLRDNLLHRDAAQLQVNAAHQALEQARETVRQLQAGASGLAQSTQAAQRQLAERAQQLEQALAQLDAAFAEAGWRQHWRDGPPLFVDQCRSQVQAWTQQQESRSALARSLETLQLQLAAAEAARGLADHQLQAHSAACQAEAGHLEALRQQRTTLLQGRAVAQAEQALQADVQQARAILEAAQAAWQQAQGEVQRLQEAQRQAGLQREQLAGALAAAQATLDDWLAAFNRGQAARQDAALLPEQLAQLLAIEPAWIAGEREVLHALHNAESAARAVLETRVASLQQHAAAKTTAESAQDLQLALQQAGEDLATASAALSALRLEIALDDQRLQQSAALRVQIAQQSAAARVWSQLGELIGSADGKKFRNFAQQLTLDVLLGYGNRHLQSLSSRYLIRRIKDSLGLLVVDQDMGDEVRSVHSLSGGESFLVSLAMALGLASLSSHRVRVESLFIDEGFGSLDADSLRVAMDALDRLQSLGRKVGVISHVQEMTERIGTRIQVQRQAGGLSRIVVA
jgi:exonuclease SbcC